MFRIKVPIFYHATIHREAQKVEPKWKKLLEPIRYLLHSQQTPSPQRPRVTGSRKGADSECRGGWQAGLLGYDDVHGDADAKAAAAESDGGGSGTEEKWRLCQCGRAGWLIVKQPDTEGQPVLASTRNYHIFSSIQFLMGDFHSKTNCQFQQWK